MYESIYLCHFKSQDIPSRGPPGPVSHRIARGSFCQGSSASFAPDYGRDSGPDAVNRLAALLVTTTDLRCLLRDEEAGTQIGFGKPGDVAVAVLPPAGVQVSA